MRLLYICDLCDAEYHSEQEACQCEEVCKKRILKIMDKLEKQTKENEEGVRSCHRCKYTNTDYYRDPNKTCQTCGSGFSNFESN